MNTTVGSYAAWIEAHYHRDAANRFLGLFASPTDQISFEQARGLLGAVLESGHTVALWTRSRHDYRVVKYPLGMRSLIHIE